MAALAARADPDTDEILDKIRQGLAGTLYECSKFTKLSGGSANFCWVGSLLAPLPSDGSHRVVLKHAEPFVASNPGMKLSEDRSHLEKECLDAVCLMGVVESGAYTVRTPTLYHFLPESHTQVQEYLPRATDLKSHALKHCALPPSLASGSDNATTGAGAAYHDVGKGIGSWLRRFHAWARDEKQTKLKEVAARNSEMQEIKRMINYGWLEPAIQKFPAVLDNDGSKAAFERMRAMAAAELADVDGLQVIHGDFWTGNIILPDEPIRLGSNTPLFVVDWEMCQLGLPALDIGQMVAEMYQLRALGNLDAGAHLVRGLCEGYGAPGDSTAFRAIAHVGAHMICIGGMLTVGWGRGEEAIEKVVREGNELIAKALARDREWFRQRRHVLDCLFGRGDTEGS